jgi:pyrroloquinoline-quinone synthase
MDVIARIDEARQRWNVLEHSFYRRWSAGELSAQELALYAGQYRHAVLALADASQALAEKATPEHRPGLERHATEEASHVAIWDEFAEAACAKAPRTEARRTKASPAEAPGGGAVVSPTAHPKTAAALPETERCAQAWTAGEDALEHLAVLYAVEASQPQIAETKLEGLVERYGYGAEGPATEYFRLHASLDVEHAAQAKALIERLMGEDAGDAGAAAKGELMLARAEAALQANWELLDGVERQFAAAG